MSAQHAGTRKWQKIINHEKETIPSVFANNNYYYEFNTANTDSNSPNENFQNTSSPYQVFQRPAKCVEFDVPQNSS